MSVKKVDAKTLKSWMDKGEAVVVDVREPDEFESGHLKGATLIPSGNISCGMLPDHKGKKLVFHCKLGKRSMGACEKVCKEDKKLEVFNLEGGITAWKDAGFPIEKGACSKDMGSCGKSECNMCCMKIENKIRVIMGAAIFLFVLMGYYVAPFFFTLTGLLGLGFMISGLTGVCMLRNWMMNCPMSKCSMCCSKSSCDTKCDSKDMPMAPVAKKEEPKKVVAKKAVAKKPVAKKGAKKKK